MHKKAGISIRGLRLEGGISHVTHKGLQATIPITSRLHIACSLTTRNYHRQKKTRLSLHQPPKPTSGLEMKKFWSYSVCHNLVTQGQVLPQSPWSPTKIVLHIDSNLRHCESTSRSRSRLGVQKKYHIYTAFAQKFKELKRLSSLWSEEGHVIDVRIIAKHFD